LNSAQRTTPSLLRAPVTVIDNFPPGCDRPAVKVNAVVSAAATATFARNAVKATPFEKHYRWRRRVTSR
jgi:hypothetical protein